MLIPSGLLLLGMLLKILVVSWILLHELTLLLSSLKLVLILWLVFHLKTNRLLILILTYKYIVSSLIIALVKLLILRLLVI